MDIRTLKANEIECRVGSFKEGKGMSLLLYKDARVDMSLLDELVGPMNWKREHKVIGSPVVVQSKDYKGNIVNEVKGQYFSCVVSIYDEKRGVWISKEDTGNESNSDEIKGLYSDSFKRACVNFGIGRELYTAPFIWIPSSKGYTKYEKFAVKEISYNDDREIDALTIVDSKGNVAYRFGCIVNELLKKVYDIASTKGYDKEAVDKHIKAKGYEKENFNNEAFKVMYEGYSKMQAQQ